MGGLFLVTALSSLKGSLYIKQGEPFELEVHKETQPVSIEMRDDSISIQTRKELTAPELDKASEDKINEWRRFYYFDFYIQVKLKI